MTLIGETGLIGNIGNIVPGAQSVPGIFNAGHIGKADGSQACILLKSANQSLLTERKLLRQCVQRRRFLKVAD